jgi:trehalose utilization protein
MPDDIRVTVWNEFRHEKSDEAVSAVYPDGMHEAIAKSLRLHPGFSVRTAWLDQPEHGLTGEILAATDVLLWWGHLAHDEVQDVIVNRVQERVLEGMGLIVLHSGHYSKIFRRLMGTSCELKWREVAEKERVWVVAPSHPIAAGLGEYFELPHEEMYGEFFDIPAPEEIVLVSWFAGGEVFRSGCCFNRGHGRIFYFCPGHETFPTYYDENVLRVITNAIHWAAPTEAAVVREFGNREALEEL